MRHKIIFYSINIYMTETRKYNTEFRKIVKERIGKLKSKNDYKYIYNLVRKTNTKITKNKNGLYFNLNCLDDDTISDIVDYLDDVL
jgi:hypothetical protein